MHTEHLVQPAIDWLAERPTLAREQMENPIFSLRRAKEEIDELITEIVTGASRENVRQELADVFNFLACAEYILFKQHNFTEEEVVDEAKGKYLRNHVKYPAIGYQNGVPPHVQLRTDANKWAHASTYEGAQPEQIIAGELY